MSFETEQEKTGFIELIYGGFMGKQASRQDCNVYTYNGGFVPNEKFFERIQNRAGKCPVDRLSNLGMRLATEEFKGFDFS